MSKHRILSILIGLISCIFASAQIRVPDIFSDNAILQQNSKVKIWGIAKANSAVSVKGSWNNEIIQIKSDANGKWIAELNTIKASFTPYAITIINEQDQYTINNVLLGDVWLCSGQSNMEMPVRGWLPECPIDNTGALVQEASTLGKSIRCVMVKEIASLQPREECKGKWQLCNEKSVLDFSAVAYCFALSLAEHLQIPIGIIVSAWGNTCIEGWMSESYLQKYANINYQEILKDAQSNAAAIRYNGMIYPLRNYAIKGFIWYQGESNVWEVDGTYAQKQKELVKCWRKDWNMGELPFYMVEIAPFNYPYWNYKYSSALIREAQLQAATTIPHCGLVSTNDLVKEYELGYDIHPSQKLPVGVRLTNFVLYNEYNNGRDPWGPIYKSMQINGNKVVLSFNHCRGIQPNSNIIGFEVAGEDQEFYPAHGRIINKVQIEISAPEVEHPIAVRYCFNDTQIGNVQSMDALPLFPFRTDKWEIKTNR